MDVQTRIDLLHPFKFIPAIPRLDPKIYLYKIIHGILFGFNDWQKEIFRGDPAKNQTFTGLIHIHVEGRDLIIERDFETNFVAFVSLRGNRLRTLYQGKDIILNGSHKVYLKSIRNLIPDLFGHLNKIFHDLSFAQVSHEPMEHRMEALLLPPSEKSETTESVHPALKLYVPQKETKRAADSIVVEHPYLFYEIFNKANKPIFLWAVNADLTPGHCIEANRAACELAGLSLDELRKLTFVDLKSERFKERMPKLLKELIQKGQLYFEAENVNKDGKIIPVAIDAHTFFIENQRVILSIVEDISQRKRIEADLKSSNEKYKALFDNAKNAVLLMDGANILDCNRAMEKILQMPKEKITGKNLADFCSSVIQKNKPVGGSQEIIENYVNEVLQTGKKCFECQFSADGKIVATAEVCLGALTLQGKTYIQAIIEDITEYRKMEEELFARNLQFQNFFDNALVGIWQIHFSQPISIDQEPREIARQIMKRGQITECNQTFLKMYQFENAEEILGKTLYFFITNEEKALENLTHFVENNFKIELMETVEKDRNGQPRYLQNSYVGYVKDGQLLWMWGLQIDVTEKKQLEEQFLQSQKMEAIGMLAGGIAHDFNNILTVINGYSDMLMRHMDADDPLMKYVSHIRKAGERASHLTGQLLSFSRKQVFQTKVMNLNDVISGMISMIQRIIGEHIEIVTRLASNLGLIKFDENKIEQIIMNMIVNAKDAMPNGGKLFIETRNVFLDEEYCSRHPEAKPGDYVLLSLTDTGHGMSEDVLQHIFEPFFTTKEKGSGTGLGLATVYGIVKQAEGHISVHSQEGQGTTFFIYFPKSTEINQEPVSEEIPQIFLNDLKGEETILVVEDDHTVRQVVVETLANYGYHILEATNGSEALEIYSLNSHKIDLVISDVVMPQMDGREFRKKILQTNPNCKFIFMSGYTDTTIMNFDELQSVEYLQKPFKLTELLRKVRSMFSKKSELTF